MKGKPETPQGAVSTGNSHKSRSSLAHIALLRSKLNPRIGKIWSKKRPVISRSVPVQYRRVPVHQYHGFGTDSSPIYFDEGRDPENEGFRVWSNEDGEDDEYKEENREADDSFSISRDSTEPSDSFDTRSTSPSYVSFSRIADARNPFKPSKIVPKTYELGNKRKPKTTADGDGTVVGIFKGLAEAVDVSFLSYNLCARQGEADTPMTSPTASTNVDVTKESAEEGKPALSTCSLLEDTVGKQIDRDAAKEETEKQEAGVHQEPAVSTKKEAKKQKMQKTPGVSIPVATRSEISLKNAEGIIWTEVAESISKSLSQRYVSEENDSTAHSREETQDTKTEGKSKTKTLIRRIETVLIAQGVDPKEAADDDTTAESTARQNYNHYSSELSVTTGVERALFTSGIFSWNKIPEVPVAYTYDDYLTVQYTDDDESATTFTGTDTGISSRRRRREDRIRLIKMYKALKTLEAKDERGKSLFDLLSTGVDSLSFDDVESLVDYFENETTFDDATFDDDDDDDDGNASLSLSGAVDDTEDCVSRDTQAANEAHDDDDDGNASLSPSGAVDDTEDRVSRDEQATNEAVDDDDESSLWSGCSNSDVNEVV